MSGLRYSWLPVSPFFFHLPGQQSRGSDAKLGNVFFQEQLASWRALLATVGSPLKLSAARTRVFKMPDELFGLPCCCPRYFPFDSPFLRRGIYIHLIHMEKSYWVSFPPPKKSPYMEYPYNEIFMLERTGEATKSNFLPTFGISSIMSLRRSQSTSAYKLWMIGWSPLLKIGPLDHWIAPIVLVILIWECWSQPCVCGSRINLVLMPHREMSSASHSWVFRFPELTWIISTIPAL